MALIFLSYTHEDEERADAVQRAIEDAGHQVWRDKKLKPGTPIPEAVAAGLASCETLVILLSANAVESNWIPLEFQNWLMNHSADTIVPLRFDDSELPGALQLLGHIKWADFRQNFDVGLQQLLERLGEPKILSDEEKASLERLDVAIDAAIKGGSISMRYYNSCLSSNLPLDVRKNATTSADKASEAEILATLERHENIRSDTVITEEAAREQLKPARKGYTWVIDPLDGTNNFRNRIPLFCTAIGILRDGQPHIGVIYDPMAGDLYYAITGSPARVWCVERGEVSNLSTDLETTDLIDCMVATHISSKPEHAAKLVAENLILRVADKTRHVRVIGSGQLALAYVASGRLQVYFQYGSHPWDQVAGVVLVRSAGGAVREIHSGSDWEYANPDFFASGSQKVGKLFAGLLGVQT